MTENPTVTILDVGHGLCAVLRDSQGTMLFDVAPGPAPRDYLRTIGTSELNAVMISHFHKDHCGGVTGFLGTDYLVEEVFMNKPRSNETLTYGEIQAALDTSRSKREGLPLIRPFDTDAEFPSLDRGAVKISIITPDALEARSDRTVREPRRKHDDHSVCGVARIDYENHPRVLLTGDLNRLGLMTVIERNPESLRADVLIYPHHGGSSTESDERGFAALLCSYVKPKLVVFSMGRHEGQRPHPEVLDGIAAVASTKPGVVCTQLSKLCDEREPDHGARLEPLPMLLSTPPDRRRLCCGGSIMIPLKDQGRADFIGDEEHAAYVQRGEILEPMCVAGNDTTAGGMYAEGAGEE